MCRQSDEDRRVEKIKKLQKAIQEGTYQVSTELLAQRMMNISRQQNALRVTDWWRPN